MFWLSFLFTLLLLASETISVCMSPDSTPLPQLIDWLLISISWRVMRSDYGFSIVFLEDVSDGGVKLVEYLSGED